MSLYGYDIIQNTCIFMRRMIESKHMLNIYYILINILFSFFFSGFSNWSLCKMNTSHMVNCLLLHLPRQTDNWQQDFAFPIYWKIYVLKYHILFIINMWMYTSWGYITASIFIPVSIESFNVIFSYYYVVY